MSLFSTYNILLHLLIFVFREKYFEEYTSLRDHVLRHNITDEEHAQSIDCVKISFENEYPFLHVLSKHILKSCFTCLLVLVSSRHIDTFHS